MHGVQQGPDSRFLDPNRPGDPGRRGQLRLRDPPASSGVVRRAHGVDGWDALPCSASARKARLCRGAVGSRGQRSPSQVLPDHVPGPGSARGRTQAVAGGGRYAAGHLAGALRFRSGQPPGVSRATFTGSLTMPAPSHAAVSLEEQIDQWRSYLRRRQAIHSVDVAELEDHLREQVAVLVEAGLATDEAFLIAVKRMGALDALSREFAREHSERLWKQLVVVPSDTGEPQASARTDAIVAF